MQSIADKQTLQLLTVATFLPLCTSVYLQASAWCSLSQNPPSPHHSHHLIHSL